MINLLKKTNSSYVPRVGTKKGTEEMKEESRDLPLAPTEETLLRWDRSAGPGCPELPSAPSICNRNARQLMGVLRRWFPQALNQEAKRSRALSTILNLCTGIKYVESDPQPSADRGGLGQGSDRQVQGSQVSLARNGQTSQGAPLSRAGTRAGCGHALTSQGRRACCLTPECHPT